MLIQQLKENHKSNAENLSSQQSSSSSTSSNTSSSSQESNSNGDDNFDRPDVIIDTKKKRKYTKRSKEGRETRVRDLDDIGL